MQPTINNKIQKKRKLLVFLLTDLNIWWYDEVGIVRLKRTQQSAIIFKTSATNHPTNSKQTPCLSSYSLISPVYWKSYRAMRPKRHQPTNNQQQHSKQTRNWSKWGEKQATIKNATNKQPIKWKEQNLPEGPGWLGLIVEQQARRGQSSPKSPCRARSAWPGYY